MITVTGGAGFIGSNLVKALNNAGHDHIIVVDEALDDARSRNIADLDIAEFIEKDDFLVKLRSDDDTSHLQAMFHLGACSDTTEMNERYLLENNFEYSKTLLNHCLEHAVPFIYASSASVYGDGSIFREDPAYERPLNPYAHSKHLFDQYVRGKLPTATSQIVGLRYFNVYGPRERHKGRMASVAFHFDQQITQSGTARLFTGSGGYEDGEQRRDFVHVEDAVAVNLWCLGRPEVSGIFNLGTGRSQTFNDVATAVIRYHGRGDIQYVPFPAELESRYQSFTEADMSALRAAGFAGDFRTVEQGVKTYLEWMHG